MKIAKVFGGIFGAIGTVLLIGSFALCLVSLNAPARMERAPEGAVSCTEQMARAISGKQFDILEECLYGQPDLGLEQTKASEIWELYEQNLAFSWQGDCYADHGGIFRKGTVTYLDVPGVLENLQTRAHDLMTQRVETATEMEQLYDETGEFRQDLVELVMGEALAACLAQDAKTVTADVTVELVRRDGTWFAVPDTALFRALAGGLQ